MADEIEIENLSETDNFVIWRSLEEKEYIYHLELGGVTLHLGSDEWEELVSLVLGAEQEEDEEE